MIWAPLLGVLFIADPSSAERVEVAAKVIEQEDDGGAAGSVISENAKEAEKLTISSLRCDFDREDGVMLFEGNARIAYSAGYFMDSDRLFVFFKGSNTVDRIVASGHVAISNETRLGRCENAVLKRGNGEVEMFGSEVEPARLAELGADEIAGKRIRFWIDTEQVEIGDSTISFESGRGGTKKMKKGMGAR